MNKKSANRQLDRRSQHRLKPVYAAVLLAFAVQTAEANPIGGTVTNGSAGFATSGNTLTVTNIPGTIINWQGFSIGSNEITNFAQQSASSTVLNRVVGNDPSNILGTLRSNGRVFLVNPNGILFGAGAVVDVAGLVASTLNLSNADFIAGRHHYTQVPGAGNISNAGNITAQDNGQIYLIAPNVENTGVITAPNGEILLAAGHSVDLVNTNDPNLRVNITAPAGDATNVGKLIASSGSLGLFGTVVRNSGMVNADSATMQGGKIVFKASQRVEAGGTISAQGVGSVQGIGGGTINLLADMQSGTVNVTGTLDASAPASGSGGFIETSAAQVQVADSAHVTTAAAQGNAGMWLLDPYDLTIAASGGDITGAALTSALNAGAVTIQTTASSVSCYGAACGVGNAGVGDIFVNDAVSWSGNLLTLNAYQSININAAMNATGTAGLTMTTAGGTVNVGMNTDGTFKGMVNLASTASLTINAQLYTIINSLGVAGDTTTNTLQGMQNNLTGNYVLGSDLNAAATSGWNPDGLGGFYGFAPVGNSTTQFGGKLEGLGHTISNLTVNNSGIDNVGLLGYINSSARVSNVAMANASITGHLEAGALVGYNNYGVVTNSSSSGSVNSFGSAGGLVGENYGTVSYSISTANVQCSDINVCGGGLVGWNNYGTISYSTATGNVSGSNEVGGLVGLNQYGTISNSAWTPTAGNTVSGNTSVGGLVGSNYYATITGSSASGAVTGGNYVGGLVGYNDFRGSISSSTASGAVTGSSYVGGLAGANYYNIDSSSASGMVSGSSYVGGLVGWNNYTYSYIYYAPSYGNISNSSATGNVTGSNNLGGLVGRNDYSASISGSNASGNVTGIAGANGTLSNLLGGLVGSNVGTISGSYASGGSVAGNSSVGGLVGLNNGTINNSYVSTGNVTGVSNVGGLVGVNSYGTLNNSHYNINGVTINGGNYVTVGGLYNDNLNNSNSRGQYDDWLLSGLSLNIDNYNAAYGGSFIGTLGGSSYAIGTTNGLKDLLGFADNSLYSFSLANNIDLTAIPSWYVPYLAANFDGAGHTLSNLDLNLSFANSTVGLFGHIAGGVTVSNLTLANASVKGTDNVGALAGWNEGTIDNSRANGALSVTGANSVGGLVGNNNGTISNTSVSSTVTVTGANSVGGLVGYNGYGYLTTSGSAYGGNISNSFVDSGTVTGTQNIGGLVGRNDGVVTNAHYNVDAVTLNGANAVTPFGLYSTQFNDWFTGNFTPLTIANYSSSLVLQGDGSYGIGTWQGMQNMLAFSDDPAAYNFSLTNNIVLNTGFWIPKLAGSFNGNNFTISNLSVNLPNSDIGLFGVTSTSSVVSNLDLVNANVSGYGNVGALVGNNYGNIDHVSVTGIVSVNGISGNIGGLVGWNNGGLTTSLGAPGTGNISNSYVDSGTVTGGSSDVGGLVGYNYRGNITSSSVINGTVSGASNVGGLVGLNWGTLIDSSSVSNSFVNGNQNVGGLVGNDGGEGASIGIVSNSFAFNTQVTGNTHVGGLIGYVGVTGSSHPTYDAVFNSYVDGDTVTSNATNTSATGIGGLVGYSSYGNISGSYVTNGTVVNGGLARDVGGLVGYNSNASISNSYVSKVTVTGSNSVGGLVGYNSLGTISNSFVNGGSVSGVINIGGLVGYNQAGSSGSPDGSYSNGIISTSYVDSGTINGKTNVGGLVGYNIGSISDTYVNSGSVTGASGGSAVGGLVGYNDYALINNSYANTVVSGGTNAGAFVGYDNGVIGNSFWDTNTSALAGVGFNTGYGWVNGAFNGMNTTDMMTQANFETATWDFGSTWWMVDGNTRPFLQMEWAANITNAHQLQLMAMNLGANYTLANDIDLGPALDNSITTGMWSNSGLVPVGNSSNGFYGTFDGQNHIISNLYIYRPTESYVGLFGYAQGIDTPSSIGNVGLVNPAVAGNSSVGALAGLNGGTISNSYVSGGNVSGTHSVGGLVGDNNYGSISDSYATANVSGTSNIGGLAGYNTGTISTSYASGGMVTGSSNVGGVVGYNDSYGGAVVSGNFWDTGLISVNLTNGIGFDPAAYGGSDIGAVGLDIAGMMTMSNFTGAGWDIANTGGAGATWRIYTNSTDTEGYTTPLLTSFLTPLTVTANDATKTYDANAFSGGNGVSYSVTGAGSSIFGTPLYGGTSQGKVNAGNYTITVAGLYSNQQGYDIINYGDGTLTINPAGLTLLNLSANNASKVYGSTLTFSGTEFTQVGLLGSDTISGMTLTSAGAVATANTGTYTITPSAAVFSVGSASNYDITYVDGQLTVTAKPITVTANALSKIYGNNDPSLTYVASGLLFSDTLTGGLSRTLGENAGSYAINQGTLANSNYTISYTGNSLNITPATLTVTADYTSKIQNTSDPLLTYMVSGLRGGDTAAATLSGALARDPGEAIGAYQINQGTLGLGSANYTMTYVGATFSILVPITVTDLSVFLSGIEPPQDKKNKRKPDGDLIVLDTSNTGNPELQSLPMCRP